jgi:hypothetical protein
MPNISRVLARVYVEDLEAAIPLYQELAQVADVSRFGFRAACVIMRRRLPAESSTH